MVRVELDPAGAFARVVVLSQGPLDGDLAQRVTQQLKEFLKDRSRLNILVDATQLRRGTIAWTLHLVTFLVENRGRLRVALHGAGGALAGLDGWARSTGVDVAAHPTEKEAIEWLVRR